MLIFARRIGESFYINDNIKVTVLGVKRTQIRIGITAPREIPILREEIREKYKNFSRKE